jgi:nucleoside 2-deoxyribosyltransferase
VTFKYKILGDIMACFLCKSEEAEENSNLNLGRYYYECPNCGIYGLYDHIHRKFLDSSDIGGISIEEFRNKAACIAAERNTKGMDKFLLLPDDVFEDWKSGNDGIFSPISITNFLSDFPQDAVEMFDRILLNLGRLIKHPVDELDTSNKNSIFYSIDELQAMFMKNELKALGWLKSSGAGCVKITPQGWKHLAELRKANAFEHSDKVFLAMWFDKTTTNFREAVRKAVELAGYHPEYITVDEVDHNDFIMDKVINMITDARFVIADFTCISEGETIEGRTSGGVRGGVYFEAGLARGQGKQVIHTCKESEATKSRLHFDINQINTIFWNEEDGVLKSYGKDFIDLLKNRIIATVGKGKHRSS